MIVRNCTEGGGWRMKMRAVDEDMKNYGQHQEKKNKDVMCG